MEVDTGPACIRCAYAVANYRLECRLKPPSPDYKSGGRIFPMMQHDDWCTKYKAKAEPAPEPKPSESFQQILDDWTEGYDDE